MTNPYHPEKSETLDYQEWSDRKSGSIPLSDHNSTSSSSNSVIIPLDLVIKEANHAFGRDAELIKVPNDGDNHSLSITIADAAVNDDDDDLCATPKKAMIHKKVLICPPAPRKKAGKKRISANHPLERETGDHKRRMIHFLTDPPDLDSFPDCIKALFKP